MKNLAPTFANASRHHGRAVQGFSLVELITCVAIIGMIAAMALPSLVGIIGQSVSAKSKRQSHCIAQTYAAACAAGVVFADSSCEGVVEALTRSGGVRGRGVFAEMTFSVSMSPEEKAGVIRSNTLVVRTLPNGSRQLEYHPDAS